MNKYVLIGCIVVFIVVILVVVKVIMNKPDYKPKKSSQELELTYEINAGIPFKWVYEIENTEIVEFVKSYVVKDENTDGKVGASVYTNYVFKGVKEGTTTITFKIVSITGEYEDSNIEVHKVKVDEKGNISLIKEE